MRARFERWLDELRTGFWFVPLLMLGLACGLAVVVLHLDERFDPGIQAALGWAYAGGPEGARSLLSTIAGSMITAASVTFSLASVALSLASQQYGSRVIRNFMRDRITQVLLGTFVSTFIYSVLVVRTIRGSDVSGGFVPAIAVSFAIGLALASLVLLILFIHHISASIQASRILSVAADNTHDAITKLYPADEELAGEGSNDVALDTTRPETTVVSHRSGYVQAVDLDAMVDIARRVSGVIELVVKPGDHLVPGVSVARVWGVAALPAEDRKAVQEALLLGSERTPAQDIRYQFQQLTDVVVRALSPGINDPFTAINGIDQIAAALNELARADRVSHGQQDEAGALRLVVPTPTLAEILDETVGHIAIYGAKDRFVMTALRRALDHVQPTDRAKSAASTAAIDRLRRLVDLTLEQNAP